MIRERMRLILNAKYCWIWVIGEKWTPGGNTTGACSPQQPQQQAL